MFNVCRRRVGPLQGRVVLVLVLLLLLLLLIAAADVGGSPSVVCTTEEHHEDHPVLCSMLYQLSIDPEVTARHIYEHALENNLLVGHSWNKKQQEKDTMTTTTATNGVVSETKIRQLRRIPRSINHLPVVFAHGMGDSCFNSGMQYIAKKAGEILGVYSVCIPTGSNLAEDTNNGYFLNMNANVKIFAAAVANNTALKNGFHAIGFSQGNNVIRGYIAQYNNVVPVHSFLSINGVNAGEGAVPHCRPEKSSDSTRLMNMCELLMEQASRAAYTEFAQEHSFQANYWRDPRPSAFSRYQEYAQLAEWNNEAHRFINETLRENWSKTQVFVWVLATLDTMVVPREGEHWAAPDPDDPFGAVLPMRETEWYKKDLFGLRTADEAGKNFFESFEGDHLAFTEDDFVRWLDTYLAV